MSTKLTFSVLIYFMILSLVATRCGVPCCHIAHIFLYICSCNSQTQTVLYIGRFHHLRWGRGVVRRLGTAPLRLAQMALRRKVWLWRRVGRTELWGRHLSSGRLSVRRRQTMHPLSVSLRRRPRLLRWVRRTRMYVLQFLCLLVTVLSALSFVTLDPRGRIGLLEAALMIAFHLSRYLAT